MSNQFNAQPYLKVLMDLAPKKYQQTNNCVAVRSKLAETTKEDQVYYFLTIAAAKHTSVHTVVCVVFQFYHQ